MKSDESEHQNNNRAFVAPDEAIQAQQDDIEYNVQTSSPLVTATLPLSTLDEDFAGHPIYLGKLKVLKEKYKSIRRFRRDGNCFYRAFGFGYIERLLGGKMLKETIRFKKKCRECRDTLLSFGYIEFTVDDFHEEFISMLDRFAVEGGSLSQLEDTFNDPAFSDYYVVFLRLLVSAYVQKNAEFYSSFVDEGRTIKEFCSTDVEPMSRDVDHIHVAALALAVGIPIWVENCQQSGELNRIEFPAQELPVAPHVSQDRTTPGSGEDTTEQEADGSNEIAPIILLYRPGHYDLLYAN